MNLRTAAVRVAEELHGRDFAEFARDGILLLFDDPVQNLAPGEFEKARFTIAAHD